MSRVCDAGAFCLQRPQCEYRCHLTDAVLEPEQETLKIPASTVPDDIKPVPDSWRIIGRFMLGAAIAILMVFFASMFFCEW